MTRDDLIEHLAESLPGGVVTPRLGDERPGDHNRVQAARLADAVETLLRREIADEIVMRCHALGHPGDCATCGPIVRMVAP